LDRLLRSPRPTHVEWAVIAMVLVAVVWFGAGHALLARVDRTLFDAGLALWRRPPPPELVIVAIDEDSLAGVGRWPWSRAVHATLVERVAAAKSRAIVLDVIVAEPDPQHPDGDLALARAIASAGNVVVASPVIAGPDGRLADLAPIAPVAAAAAALAHPGVDGDEDGVVRSLDLLDGARGARPYLGLAALQVAGLSPRVEAHAAGSPAPGESRYFVPWYGPAGTVRTVSYLSVLRGDVPATEFAGRLVFVGTTATGLGDAHPVPAGGRAAPMPGVEIAAQVAGSLREGIEIRAATPGQAALVSAALVLVLLSLYRVLQPRVSFALTAAMLAATLVGAFLLLRLAQAWIPPSAALVGIGMAYPLWSWRRLEAALRYMRGELERLRKEPGATPVAPKAAESAAPADMVDATIAPLEAAIAGLRDARRFIADTVESLPQALIVADADGRVVLANPLAREWAGFDTATRIADAGLDAHAAPERTLAQALLDFSLAGSRTWESLVDESFATGRGVQADARGPGGRDVLVLISPCYRANGERTGLIVNMVDVSDKREAERRREDLMRILSHDMRSPQASILTLIETRALDPARVDTETLVARVEAFSRRTLALADDFLRLARAEQARPDQFEPLDLADVAFEACEEAWTLANAKSIRIRREFAVEEAPVDGDRSLLLRMLHNLLSNAVKYSAPGTTVTVGLEPQGISWLLRVADEGRGIAKEDLPRLFTRFGRVAAGEGDPGGVGLGLVMVRTVVERHRGVVSVASEPGKGSVFSVSLPARRGRA
jgi:signal transduction histidine kinase/CHASE2 domain-containing sensor protein